MILRCFPTFLSVGPHIWSLHKQNPAARPVKFMEIGHKYTRKFYMIGGIYSIHEKDDKCTHNSNRNK